MMPEAMMVKITIKSILGERVNSNPHSPTHRAAIKPNLIFSPVVILFVDVFDCRRATKY